ncbi:hypothetical protein GEV33_013383 [Tenebrio molitor]|uniref:Reverse transcriptase domain-containing protein n=1 Tax=Tenebrio molitor TaxID=7067 RepID=A0A8J6L814_TENMO|nr:hypothetical protein GEV33_013383 [Tenebrio molitor]
MSETSISPIGGATGANCFAQSLQSIHQVPNHPNFDNDFFTRVTRSVNFFRRNLPIRFNRPHVDDDTLTEEILPDEVEALIKILKNNKAPGPDNLRTPLFKHLPRIAIEALTVIFNNCLRAHYFPPAWKHATTIMIPKPGKDPTNPQSYRPISLLNITGKILEKILTSRLKHVLETNNLLPPEQFGFRNKLISLRLNPNFIKIIDSFLTNRTCRVKIQNSKSASIQLQAGVPQGSILSPMLYITYCRDFPVSDDPRTKTRLFADDTAVWTSQRNPLTARRILQDYLEAIESWTNSWRIKPNPLKVRGHFRGCDPKTLFHTYKSFIRPVTEYRAPIYASLYPASLKQISACERRILRRIFRLHYTFPSSHLHQKTKSTPIQDRLQLLQRRFVIRTLNSNNPTAIQTISTSYKCPGRNGNLLNRIPKIPRRKLKHPPTALLSTAYDELPNYLQDSPVRPRTSLFKSSPPLLHQRASSPDQPGPAPPQLSNTHLGHHHQATIPRRLRRRFFLLVFPFVHSANAGVLPEDGYRRTQFLSVIQGVNHIVLNDSKPSGINHYRNNDHHHHLQHGDGVLQIHVGHDITPEDVIAATSLKIIKAWRITSKKNDRPTTLIRITITERESLDALLLKGINLFGRNYECEASHPPAPTPVQCAKCFQFGHELAACLNKQVCPQCPNSHPPNKCPEKDPICTSCKGSHPAWSRTCPILKEITITDDTPVLPVKIIDPPAEFADPCSPSDDSEASDPLMEAPLAVVKGIISFTMKALFDLFPLQKAKIQKILEETSKAVFNVTTKVSHSGHKIHFTYDLPTSGIRTRTRKSETLLVSDALASVSHDLPPNLTHLEAIAAKITISNLTILIISYYNLPSEKVSAELLSYLTQFDYAIILGDFNARHALAVTSDHLPLVTNLTIAGPPERPNFIPVDDFNQTNWQAYQRQISEHLPEIIQTTEPTAIDAQVTRFAETVIRAKEITVPRKYIPTNKRPIPRTILDKIHEKRKVYRRFILTRDPFLKTIFNKLNAQIRRDLNKYREDQWIDTCRSLDYRDGKSFWSRFQQITGQKKHSNHHLIHQNQTLSTPHDKANCFAQTLQEIHQVPDDPHFDNRFFNKVTQNVTNFFNIAPNPPDRLPLEDQSLTEQIHTEEIAAHIKYLKNRKAPGPDSIKPILLKKLPRDAIEKLTTIYNNCIQACYFPTAWKNAKTIMIPKPGKNPSDPRSYRPISLLNIIGKILEKVLSARLKLSLESNNLLPSQQFGFRAQRSTINPILELHTDSTRHANLKEYTLAVFLDIERAFDKVWHDGLLQKFISLQTNPMFTRMIKSFLENRTCSVQVNHQNSAPIHIHAGVPQGSVLSPILYLVYCSDFPVSDTSRTKTRMFADDTTLWTCSKNPEFAQKIIQRKLRSVERWANSWRVKPNPLKSQCILMSYPGQKQPQRQFDNLHINNLPIPKLKTIRYLGVAFSHNCSLHPDVQQTLKKTRNRANLLHPSNLVHLDTNTTPIQDRLTTLQKKYIDRTINSHNEIAIQTLHTSHKLPTLNGTLLNRIPRVPRLKQKHPPTALVSAAYPDLPPALQEIDTPTSPPPNPTPPPIILLLLQTPEPKRAEDRPGTTPGRPYHARTAPQPGTPHNQDLHLNQDLPTTTPGFPPDRSQQSQGEPPPSQPQPHISKTQSHHPAHNRPVPDSVGGFFCSFSLRPQRECGRPPPPPPQKGNEDHHQEWPPATTLRPPALSPRAPTPRAPTTRAPLRDLPEELPLEDPQTKKFYKLLTTHLVTRNIHKSIVNWNRTALLIISLPIDDKFTAQLNSATGSRNITCAPINQKTANNPNSDNPRKKLQRERCLSKRTAADHHHEKKSKNAGDRKIKVAPVVASTSTSSKASTPASSVTPSPTKSSTTATTTSNTEAETFKYTSFYTVLCTHLGLKYIQLTVNFNKTALLILQSPITETVIQKLKISTNSKDITVTPINKRTKKPNMAKQLTFSVVIKKGRISHKQVVNWNKTAFLITSLPLPDKFTHNLNAATGSKTMFCSPLKRKSGQTPNQTGKDSIRKKPQLSVVVKPTPRTNAKPPSQLVSSAEVPTPHGRLSLTLRYVYDGNIHEDFVSLVDAIAELVNAKHKNDYESDEEDWKEARKLWTAEEALDEASTPRELSLTAKAIGQIVLSQLKKRLKLPLERCIGIGTDGCAAKTTLDLNDSAVQVNNTISILASRRENVDNSFNNVWQRAENLADQLGVELNIPRIPRRSGRQIYRANHEANSAEEYYRVSIYAPLLDFVLTDLRKRFSAETLDVFQLSVFIPENIVKNNPGENDKISKSLLDRFGSLLDVDKGVATILLKDEIKGIPYTSMKITNTSLETAAIQLEGNGPAIVGAYNPPQNYFKVSELAKILGISNKIIPAGDLNAKNIAWNCNTNETNGITLEKFLNTSGTRINFPNEPTHTPLNGTSPTTIDIFLVKNILNYTRAKTLNELNSDHCPITMETTKMYKRTGASVNKNLMFKFTEEIKNRLGSRKREFWNSNLKNKHELPPLQLVNGDEAVTDIEKAEVLVNHFQSIHQDLFSTSTPEQNHIDSDVEDILNIQSPLDIEYLESVRTNHHELDNEKIIQIRLNKSQIPTQMGFKKDHRTSLQLARIINEILVQFYKDKTTAMTLLDLEKAFDTVWMNGLVKKMCDGGIDLNFAKSIHSYLAYKELPKDLSSHRPSSICLLLTSQILKNPKLPYMYADDMATYAHSFYAPEATPCSLCGHHRRRRRRNHHPRSYPGRVASHHSRKRGLAPEAYGDRPNGVKPHVTLEQEWGLPLARQVGKLIYTKDAPISCLFRKKKNPRSATAVELTPYSLGHLQGPLRATIVQNAKQTGNQGVCATTVQMENEREECCVEHVLNMSSPDEVYGSVISFSSRDQELFYHRIVALPRKEIVKLVKTTKYLFQDRKVRISTSTSAHSIRTMRRGGGTGLRGTFLGHPRPFHLTFTDVHNNIYTPMGALPDGTRTRADLAVLVERVLILPSTPYRQPRGDIHTHPWPGGGFSLGKILPLR